MNENNWKKYYSATKENFPRKTLIRAIKNFNQEDNLLSKFAIDLGSGAGADTIELLKRNWSVLAIDSQSMAISTLLSSAQQLMLDKKLTAKISLFESLTFLPSADLINANFSLPFMKPNHFYRFWEIIVTSLQLGGRFSGSFFGIHDGWNNRNHMTFLTREKIYRLFRIFNVELIEEEEKDAPDALGHMKHWHNFFVVAKK